MIIDTHLHVIDQSALAYPWLAGEPALNRDFLYEEYAREARRVGISTSLHMEVDVAAEDIEKETDYVGELSEQPGNLIVGAISACRPEEQGFAAFLERQKANPFVKGFRRVLHVMPDELVRKRAFPRQHQAPRRHGSDLRSRGPAAPDSQGDRVGRSGA